MKESPLDEKFKAAADKCRENFKGKNLPYFLSALRDAASALQEGGEHVSLEVRPRLDGIARSFEKSQVYANATLTVGDVSTDWVIRSDDSSSVKIMMLEGYSGASRIENVTTYAQHYGSWSEPYLGGNGSLKDVIINAVMSVRAEREILREYEVGHRAPLSVDKPFPIAGPLKLKGEPKP